MKSFVKKTRLCTLLGFASRALSACGKTNDSASSSGKEEEDVKFVAVTSTAFDAEVTVGSHKYKLGFDLKKDNSLQFNAVCTGKGSSGGRGPGGGGFPGMGGPGGGQGQSETSEAEETDFTKYDFSFKGTWSMESGYGYVLNLSDSASTVIHADYRKTQGRHQFYYNVTTSEGSSVALFQYKDSEFAKTLASDYKTWDERDSDYIFEAATTGNNGSLATAYLYAHKDGSVVVNKPSGANRQVSLGATWKAENGNFVLTDGRETYTAANSLDSAKTGYRLAYSSLTFFCSTSSVLKNNERTNELFDGKTLYPFTGSYTTEGPDGGEKAVELNLTDNENKRFLYTAGNLSKQGTYAFENEKFTLSFAGEDPVEVLKDEEGKYVYVLKIQVQSFFGGASTKEVPLTYVPKGA